MQDDTADLATEDVTARLDSIPGAWERVLEGEDDARAGRLVPLEEL